MENNLQNDFFESCKKEKTDKIKSFIGKKVDLNLKDDRGSSPLSLLANRGHIEGIELLLNAGAMPSQESLLTGLMFFSGWKNEESIIKLVKLYISKGYEINQYGADGRTILHEAAYYDLPLVIDELVKLGADLSLRTKKFNETAIEQAAESGSTKAYNALKKYVS